MAACGGPGKAKVPPPPTSFTSRLPSCTRIHGQKFHRRGGDCGEASQSELVDVRVVVAAGVVGGLHEPLAYHVDGELPAEHQSLLEQGRLPASLTASSPKPKTLNPLACPF